MELNNIHTVCDGIKQKMLELHDKAMETPDNRHMDRLLNQKTGLEFALWEVYKQFPEMDPEYNRLPD